MIALPEGMKFSPVYSKCPKCGCDLEKWHDSSVEQVSANQAKNRTGDTECALETSAKKSLAIASSTTVYRGWFFHSPQQKNTPPREIRSAELVGSFGSSPPAVERNTTVQMTINTLYQTSN